MDGTSAINILYQYPLWSLSQSAEMTCDISVLLV